MSGPGGSPPSPPSPPATKVVVTNVSKWFGDLVAVSDVSFEVGPGVTALLGPNGAGKSTLLRLLAGLTSPSQGQLAVLGRDPRRDLALTRQMGLVPQQEALPEVLTAFELVRLAAVLHQVPEPDVAATRALATVELDPGDRRRLPSYSKGMRQRAKVAQAIVHGPDVLLLDEPLTGLDPRQRLHMIDLFRRLGSDDRCVIVSSHVLDEVARFGSRVLVMAEGRLAAEGDFKAIRDLMDDRPRRLRVRTDRPRDLGARLLGSGVAVGVRVDRDSRLTVDTADVAAFRRAVVAQAHELGARLYEVVPLDEDLESVFRYLVDPAASNAARGAR